jgi:hypothetical protein
MEETVKFCRGKAGKEWYLYGFTFNPPDMNYGHCIVTYTRKGIKKWYRDMICVDAPSNLKNMFLSKDPKDHTMAIAVLETLVKTEAKPLNYKIV